MVILIMLDMLTVEQLIVIIIIFIEQ